MQSTAATIKEYINEAPDDRKSALEQLRKVIKNNLPMGFTEAMGYGMVGFVVPHSIYPAGYHCSPELPLPFISFASQKNFIAIYHMGLYAEPQLLTWFTDEYSSRVKGKLDMGKSCIRFKKPESIPFELIGELCTKMTVQDWIALYEKNYKR